MHRRPENLRHNKHLAFQIVAQLPEEQADALVVLEYARRLVLQELDEPAVVSTLRLVEKN